MSTIIKDDTNDNVNKAPKTTAPGTRNKNLQFLENLEDYKVHHDDVDPRGYTVKLASGEKIGEVEGLLADINAKLVRYVEVEFEDEVIGRHTANTYREEDKHALIPAGLVDINTSSNTVTLHGIDMAQLVDYPRFQKSQGYTTRYEVDTNDYLADFHDYGSKYDRKRFSTDTYRNADTLEVGFYNTGFYAEKYR